MVGPINFNSFGNECMYPLTLCKKSTLEIKSNCRRNALKLYFSVFFKALMLLDLFKHQRWALHLTFYAIFKEIRKHLVAHMSRQRMIIAKQSNVISHSLHFTLGNNERRELQICKPVRSSAMQQTQFIIIVIVFLRVELDFLTDYIYVVEAHELHTKYLPHKAVLWG